MELCDIDVKMEDEDLALILLIYLPPSYENFVSSFSIGKDSITLEEVKYNLYSRELQLKVFGNGDKASAFGLLVTDFAKGKKKKKKKKKDKDDKKKKIDPKDIYNYYKELSHWK